MSTRYYNPEVGRFLNADALASTGQGILGNNMLAYCQNNPVVCIDPDGLCREVGPNLIKVLDCAQPDCKLSKYYVENEKIRKAVQVANAVMENLELECAVGLGLYGGTSIMDGVDVSGGLRYDLICIGYADGDFYHQQAYYEGFELWIVKLIGFDIYPSQKIRDNPITGSDLDWREDPTQDSWTIFDIGAYAAAGGRFRIGFDSISFSKELDRIFL